MARGTILTIHGRLRWVGEYVFPGAWRSRPHSGACTCAECRGPSNADTVAAIKTAIKHAADCKCRYCGGKGKKIRPGRNARPLSADELLALTAVIEGAIHLGKPPKRRGPTPKGTQYDAAFKRRKDLWRRLCKLPNLRKGRKAIPDDLLLEIARSVPDGWGWAKRTLTAFQIRYPNKPCPDISTVRKLLKTPQDDPPV